MRVFVCVRVACVCLCDIDVYMRLLRCPSVSYAGGRIPHERAGVQRGDLGARSAPLAQVCEELRIPRSD